MELNKKNTKSIIVIIVFSILLYWSLQNTYIISNIFGNIIKIIWPFILGLIIAFLLNIPMKSIEDKIFYSRNNKKIKRTKKTWIRIFAIVLSILLVFGILLFIFLLVIPELINTISLFKDNVPKFVNEIKEIMEKAMKDYPDIVYKMQEINIDWESLNNEFALFLKSGITGILSSSINVVLSIVEGISSFVVGLIFAIYVLAQKEKLLLQLKKSIYVIFKEKTRNRIFSFCSRVNYIFSKFISGQLTEALILGMITFIGMIIFKFPYSLTISVLVGFTALIPVFGAFIGAIIGSILISVISPSQAFWFIIYITVIQQLEGNLIYPRVIGDSIGLPAIWVMVAVIIGGGSFGVIGMLIGVPFASVIYSILKDVINKRYNELNSNNKIKNSLN